MHLKPVQAPVQQVHVREVAAKNNYAGRTSKGNTTFERREYHLRAGTNEWRVKFASLAVAFSFMEMLQAVQALERQAADGVVEKSAAESAAESASEHELDMQVCHWNVRRQLPPSPIAEEWPTATDSTSGGGEQEVWGQWLIPDKDLYLVSLHECPLQLHQVWRCSILQHLNTPSSDHQQQRQQFSLVGAAVQGDVLLVAIASNRVASRILQLDPRVNNDIAIAAGS